MKRGHRYRVGRNLGQIFIHVILGAIGVGCLLPLLLIISASFSEEADIAIHGYTFFPRRFTTYAYGYILQNPTQILRGYGVTTYVTAVGTIVGLMMMSLLAYVLSRPDFPWRKHLSFYVFFTMLFNGGLVPWYIWMTQGLHLKETVWSLIWPYLVVPWYVLLLRTYFSGLPQDLLDAAKIDGAGEWRLFFQIVVPLSTPSLATVGLFLILQYWNDWYLAMLFVQEKANLQPLQYMLYRILTNVQAIARAPGSTSMPPILTVRMAMSVLATGPAALVFLFVQRYFVRGITIGGLKY
jgi:putative aldouronate transport system permease protein